MSNPSRFTKDLVCTEVSNAISTSASEENKQTATFEKEFDGKDENKFAQFSETKSFDGSFDAGLRRVLTTGRIASKKLAWETDAFEVGMNKPKLTNFDKTDDREDNSSEMNHHMPLSPGILKLAYRSS